MDALHVHPLTQTAIQTAAPHPGSSAVCALLYPVCLPWSNTPDHSHSLGLPFCGSGGLQLFLMAPPEPCQAFFLCRLPAPGVSLHYPGDSLAFSPLYPGISHSAAELWSWLPLYMIAIMTSLRAINWLIMESNCWQAEHTLQEIPMTDSALILLVKLDAKPSEKKFLWIHWDDVKETLSKM